MFLELFTGGWKFLYVLQVKIALFVYALTAHTVAKKNWRTMRLWMEISV